MPVGRNIQVDRSPYARVAERGPGTGRCVRSRCRYRTIRHGTFPALAVAVRGTLGQADSSPATRVTGISRHHQHHGQPVPVDFEPPPDRADKSPADRQIATHAHPAIIVAPVAWLNNQPYLLLSLASLFWAGNIVLARYVAGHVP